MAWNEKMKAGATEGGEEKPRGVWLVKSIESRKRKGYDLKIEVICCKEDTEFAERVLRTAIEEVQRENCRLKRQGKATICYKAICTSK